MKDRMLEVIFKEIQDEGAGRDGSFGFAVIAAKYQGKWVFCKHKERDTLEFPGGHWEKGERIEETARRELYEETGAREYTLTPVADYGVRREGEAEISWGRFFFAEITAFGDLPEYEIEKIVITEELPEAWTYPQIQPRLFKRLNEWLTNQQNYAKVNKIIE